MELERSEPGEPIDAVHRAGDAALQRRPGQPRQDGVLEHAVTRHAGAAAGAFVRRVFSLNDRGVLEELFREAGFAAVHVAIDTRDLRLPAARDFLWGYVHSTPLAGPVGELDEAGRTALERDVVAGWKQWSADRGLAYEQAILTASAHT